MQKGAFSSKFHVYVCMCQHFNTIKRAKMYSFDRNFHGKTFYAKELAILPFFIMFLRATQYVIITLVLRNWLEGPNLQWQIRWSFFSAVAIIMCALLWKKSIGVSKMLCHWRDKKLLLTRRRLLSFTEICMFLHRWVLPNWQYQLFYGSFYHCAENTRHQFSVLALFIACSYCKCH